jgi:hypothetical protein
LLRDEVKNNLPQEIKNPYLWGKNMIELSSEVKSSINSALNKLTGYKRRAYAAEICAMYFDSSARKMERFLKAGREMIELGQHERRTGLRCFDSYHFRGAKKKKTLIPP